MKINFQVLKYSFTYIFIMLMTHFVCLYLIGMPNLYDIHILIVPFYNYLVLDRGIMLPLSKKINITKKDIMISFLIITSLFNIIFYWLIEFTITEIIIIVIINIIEFVLMKPPVDKMVIATQKNIDEYFKKRRKKEE